MKILYYFPDIETPMFEWQRTHFFDELCHYSVEIDSFNPLLCENWEEANEQIVKKAQRGSYDLFLADICSEKMLFKDTLLSIRSLGVPTLCFRPDNLVIPYNDKDLSPFFDLVWLTSKETKWMYDKWGANNIVEPYAANPFKFSFMDCQLLRHVGFIGTPYGSRALMINTLTSNEVCVDLYYGNFQQNNNKDNNKQLKLSIIQQTSMQNYVGRLQYKEGRKLLMGAIVNKIIKGGTINENSYLSHFPAVLPSQLSEYYSKYVLSLASTSTNHTDALKEPLKIVNLRNFEIPMSGGIEICKYNPELANYFEEDKEILFYREKGELVEKAKYYTKRAPDKVIRDMKIAARRRSENEHTWRHRFNAAFEKLGLKKV